MAVKLVVNTEPVVLMHVCQHSRLDLLKFVDNAAVATPTSDQIQVHTTVDNLSKTLQCNDMIPAPRLQLEGRKHDTQ